MKLIDPKMSLDTIKSYIEVWDCDGCLTDGGTQHNVMAVDDLQYLPTIEAEPVRHGRWIEKPPYADETVKGLEFQIVCSRCDEQNASITFDENSVPIAKTFYRTRFCPNCGADMREDTKCDESD